MYKLKVRTFLGENHDIIMEMPLNSYISGEFKTSSGKVLNFEDFVVVGFERYPSIAVLEKMKLAKMFTEAKMVYKIVGPTNKNVMGYNIVYEPPKHSMDIMGCQNFIEAIINEYAIETKTITRYAGS